MADLEDIIALFNRLLSSYNETYSTTTTLDLWIDEEFEEFALIGHPPPGRISLETLNSFSGLRSLSLLEDSPLYLLPLLQSKSLPGDLCLPSLCRLRLIRTDFDGQHRAIYLAILKFLAYRSENFSPLEERFK